VIRYLLSAAPKNHATREDIKEAVVKVLSTRGGEIMYTIGDELREEGRKQGIEQGMQQGIIQTGRENVIDSLEARFDVVPESMIKSINQINDPAILRILHRKAVRVESLDEFTHILRLALK
jgi:hypothetical protein